MYTSLYLQNVVGLSPIRTGLVFLPSTFIVFVVSGLTAQLQARNSARGLLVAGLSGAVAGRVFTGDHPDVPAETAGYNTAAIHRPLVVVGALTARDVSEAVSFTAAHDLPVGVLATGHGGTSMDGES